MLLHPVSVYGAMRASVCVCEMTEFLAKCLLLPLSAESPSGSAHLRSRGCARRAGASPCVLYV